MDEGVVNKIASITSVHAGCGWFASRVSNLAIIPSQFYLVVVDFSSSSVFCRVFFVKTGGNCSPVEAYGLFEPSAWTDFNCKKVVDWKYVSRLCGFQGGDGKLQVLTSVVWKRGAPTPTFRALIEAGCSCDALFDALGIPSSLDPEPFLVLTYYSRVQLERRITDDCKFASIIDFRWHERFVEGFVDLSADLLDLRQRPASHEPSRNEDDHRRIARGWAVASKALNLFELAKDRGKLKTIIEYWLYGGQWIDFWWVGVRGVEMRFPLRRTRVIPELFNPSWFERPSFSLLSSNMNNFHVIFATSSFRGLFDVYVCRRLVFAFLCGTVLSRVGPAARFFVCARDAILRYSIGDVDGGRPFLRP
jgi:hypothetical protein